MDQVADIARLNAAVLQEAIDARIDGHDRVEDAGVRIRVELDQDFGFGHGSMRSAECAVRNAE